MAAERHLSPKDIAEALGCSMSGAYRAVRQMRRVKFGQTVRVSESAFAEWLQQKTLEPARRVGAPAPPPTTTSVRRPHWSDERVGRDGRPFNARNWKELLTREAAEGRSHARPAPKPKIGVPRKRVELAVDRPRNKPTRPRT